MTLGMSLTAAIFAAELGEFFGISHFVGHLRESRGAAHVALQLLNAADGANSMLPSYPPSGNASTKATTRLRRD